MTGAMAPTIVPVSDAHYAPMAALEEIAFGAGWSDAAGLRRHCALGGALVIVADAHEAFDTRLRFIDTDTGAMRMVVGLRVWIAPGQWRPGLWADMAPCCEDVWRAHGLAVEQLAFAKAIIVHPALQGRGLGEALLMASFRAIKCAGAMGVLTHLWAPQKSAVALARKPRARVPLIEVATHRAPWFDYSVAVGWQCPFCTPAGCRCDAIEVLYDLRGDLE